VKNMGIRCSCGVISTLPVPTFVGFLFADGTTHAGPATFTVNVCADRPELGTTTLVFVDTDPVPPNRSFVFTSTIIESVTCDQTVSGCVVTVIGQGLVTGETQPRMFTFQFQDGPTFDLVTLASINGFAMLSSNSPIPNGTFTAVGCD
jgi:hypothetical protein